MAAVFKDTRKRAYLNAEGADKPLRSPVPIETLKRARAFRKARVVAQLKKHDCAAIILYDPCNIRHAIDASNMQVWMLHNPSHYAAISADGHAVDFEYKGSEHIVRGIETIDEIRPARNWFYMSGGSRQQERLTLWADEIADLVRERGGAKGRIAVDKVEWLGVDALRARGFTVVEG